MTGDTELGLLLHDPFPEPEPPAEQLPAQRRARRHLGRPRTVTAIVIVVVLVAAAGGIWAATGSSAATYRWTTVTKADVDQTLDSYGTVTPIHQANVTFPVSGTVATVPVTVGQHVTTGQTLATLDVSSLQSKLDSAKASYTTAVAKLVADQEAQATGTTVSATNTSATLSGADTGQATPLETRPSSGGSTGSGGGGGGGTGGTGGSSSAQEAVTAAQAKLLTDQHTVDTLTDGVAADLRLGTSTCASLIASLQNLTLTPQSATPSAPASPSAQNPAGAGSPQVPDTSACTTLLNKILADQQAVTAAQTVVSNDETALTTAVEALAAAAKSGGSTGGSTSGGSTSGGSTSGSTSSGRSSGSGSGGSGSSDSSSSGSSGSSFSGSGRTSSGGGGGTTVTAEQLVVDQTTVDADAANAFVAAEALNQATLVSPLAGTVAAVNVSAGSTAGTSSAAVTVIGPGADQVSTTVSDLDLKQIRVGSDASITTDGSNTPLHGTVTAIGLLPVSTSSSSSSNSSRTGSAAAASSSSGSSSSSTTSTSSSATYPVTISLDTGGLYSGSGADVSIVVKKLTNVVAVPTSAVTSLGTLHTVTVQSGGKATRRVVVVGASDATFTQITSGLSQGQHIALAQVNLPVPSSGSTNLARLAGGGGIGGAGGAGGRFTRTGTAGATRTGG
ncbi:MAG TPA: biotin/lipoyl-binding protein [Frankiaceae bacterium]|nr:biotin/lipoyl-binding protein [Frankiaceae bacterium]